MTMKSDAASSKLQGELVITRVFDAPPEVVFKAWTDPKQVEQWWGPIVTPIRFVIWTCGPAARGAS